MLPQYERLESSSSQTIFRIPFGKFAVAIVSCPLFGFLFCLAWSLIYNFEKANSTHCLVYNFLPSLSAAIGNYQPQRFVWQLSVLVHAPPRFIVSYMYRKYNCNLLDRAKRPFANICCFLNAIEIIVLVGLTLWTSVNHYEIHKNCFVTFIITSLTYMLFSSLIPSITRKTDILSADELQSQKYKKRLLFINALAMVSAGYFFVRHNTYCEPGVYSLFALSEYIFVFTNMGFHMTAYWDFKNANLLYDWKNGIHFSSL